ncbi:MAG: hypothetical protein IKP58_16145 [Victivallales bacterium]|nr:hypothetical protein [Victivallales bacterium]
MKNNYIFYMIIKRLILGISLFFLSGCCLIKHDVPIVHERDLSWEKEQLRNIASLCGIPLSKTSDMDIKELLIEIKIRFNNSESYSNHVLTTKNFKDISEVFYDDVQLINTIKDYDAFIKKVHGKQILILEDGE